MIDRTKHGIAVLESDAHGANYTRFLQRLTKFKLYSETHAQAKLTPFSLHTLYGPGRTDDVVKARVEIWRWMHDIQGMSHAQIGRLWDRHHTTVLYALGWRPSSRKKPVRPEKDPIRDELTNMMRLVARLLDGRYPTEELLRKEALRALDSARKALGSGRDV